MYILHRVFPSRALTQHIHFGNFDSPGGTSAKPTIMRYSYEYYVNIIECDICVDLNNDLNNSLNEFSINCAYRLWENQTGPLYKQFYVILKVFFLFFLLFISVLIRVFLTHSDSGSVNKFSNYPQSLADLTWLEWQKWIVWDDNKFLPQTPPPTHNALSYLRLRPQLAIVF